MKKVFKGIHYPYTKLSKHICQHNRGCSRKIKARLVLIKQSIPKYCYRHWHFILEKMAINKLCRLDKIKK